MVISIDQFFVNGMSTSAGVPTARRAAGNSDATNGKVSRKREVEGQGDPQVLCLLKGHQSSLAD